MVSDSEQNKECFQCEVTLFIFVRFEFIQSLLFWLRWCFFQQTALLRNKTSIFYIMGPMKLQTNDISEEIIETNFRLPDTCNEQTIRTMDWDYQRMNNANEKGDPSQILRKKEFQSQFLLLFLFALCTLFVVSAFFVVVASLGLFFRDLVHMEQVKRSANLLCVFCVVNFVVPFSFGCCMRNVSTNTIKQHRNY